MLLIKTHFKKKKILCLRGDTMKFAFNKNDEKYFKQKGLIPSLYDWDKSCFICHKESHYSVFFVTRLLPQLPKKHHFVTYCRDHFDSINKDGDIIVVNRNNFKKYRFDILEIFTYPQY